MHTTPAHVYSMSIYRRCSTRTAKLFAMRFTTVAAARDALAIPMDDDRRAAILSNMSHRDDRELLAAFRTAAADGTIEIELSDVAREGMERYEREFRSKDDFNSQAFTGLARSIYAKRRKR